MTNRKTFIALQAATQTVILSFALNLFMDLYKAFFKHYFFLIQNYVASGKRIKPLTAPIFLLIEKEIFTPIKK